MSVYSRTLIQIVYFCVSRLLREPSYSVIFVSIDFCTNTLFIASTATTFFYKQSSDVVCPYYLFRCRLPFRFRNDRRMISPSAGKEIMSFLSAQSISVFSNILYSLTEPTFSDNKLSKNKIETYSSKLFGSNKNSFTPIIK